MEENKNIEEIPVEGKVENAGEEVVVKEGIGKKVLKITLKVLAGAAAIVAGVFIGRATKGRDSDSSDDDSSQESSDE